MLKNPHIIIIGAGVAGLATARRLFEKGYTKLTILEGENRIGGRINTIKFFDNKIIELGAQWCHGEEENIIYNLVKDLKVLGESSSTYEELNFYDSSGNAVNKNVAEALYGLFAEICEDEDGLIKAEGSFGDYFIKRFNESIEKIFPDDKRSLNTSLILRDWLHKLILCYDGASSWFDISASGTIVYQECDGNLLLRWKHHGFRTILDVLMKEYPNKSERLPIREVVQFNKEVKNINWDNDQITVKCSDGSKYLGDHVVLTTSLGVLKENYKEMFTPELPISKINAIEALGIGTVNKIFLRFPWRWWPNDCTEFNFVWNEEDKLHVANEFPQGFLKNGQLWLESIFGFYVTDSDPNTLMGWSVGSLAQEIELLPEDIVLDGCKYLLNKFLSKTHRDIPAPVKMIRSKWYTNKHFRGSYSYRSVDSDIRNASAKDLAEPLKGPSGKVNLLFAGEATHDYFYSSAHGALETGFREADRIIELYTKPMQRSCKIAIVGCGMAGLGAACTFLEAGVEDILILEATDKLGGRIETISVNGNVVEMGAQWLHGVSTYLHKLAVENDLILEETSDEGLGIYIRNDGVIFDDFFVKKIDFIIGKILEDCEKFVDSNDYPTSVGEFLQREFNKFIQNSNETKEFKEMALELFDWHDKFQIIDNSCIDLTQVSAKDWGKYSCLGKDGQKHMNIKNGYKTLVDLLVKSIPANVIQSETPVLKIDYSQRKISLKCRGGTDVIADHVIVTPSIGVLKQDLLQFHPNLPQNISTTIKSLGFHGMGKIYLIFEKKWWKVDGFQLVWKKNFLVAEDRVWIKHLTGFDVVLNQPNVLVGWIGGKGIEMVEHLSEDTIGLHCVEILRMFLRDATIPLPEKVLRCYNIPVKSRKTTLEKISQTMHLHTHENKDFLERRRRRTKEC